MWRKDKTILTPEALARRAGGRRRHNSVRQLRALVRRMQVARLLLTGVRSPRQLAARLHVDTSTITRDLQVILYQQPGQCCPTCGRPFERQLPPGYRP